ncbi:chalcone isomerase family protein [Psychroflexus sediminis]|uniref:Chalcone isomerase-like n=1 Tax=Psychroflexus sediminis TaxID=470826 RepID=A0A1G7V4G4_9FLAO|nr:chalcone isomerase family protein [Psychroflexus sediminis]SDG54458.1 Chalcone isomerase-like [Psychroflexus sediminis]
MKTGFFMIVAFLVATSSFAQTEIAGIVLPNTFEIGETQLSLNGAGVREKYWMDMYAGGLYTAEKMNVAQNVRNADVPMLIKLHIVSGLISSDKMSSSVEDGFENSTGGNTEPFRAKIDKFKSFFSEEITKNDVFDITYTPATGVVVFKNYKELGTIEGLDFKKVLFGIWFGEKPADKDLMKGMLNQ